MSTTNISEGFGRRVIVLGKPGRGKTIPSEERPYERLARAFAGARLFRLPQRPESLAGLDPLKILPRSLTVAEQAPDTVADGPQPTNGDAGRP